MYRSALALDLVVNLASCNHYSLISSAALEPLHFASAALQIRPVGLPSAESFVGGHRPGSVLPPFDLEELDSILSGRVWYQKAELRCDHDRPVIN